MKFETPAASPASIHTSVLLAETVEALRPRPGGRYLDGTVGMGGHAAALLQRAGEGAELCGLDRDVQALELARIRLEPFGERAHLTHTRYSGFAAALDSLGWDTVDGVLIDIGVSSLQIDSAERGFSFSVNGPLDMRMDRDSDELPVSRLVNRAKVEELKDIIERYGEDPQAGRIARCIVEGRIRKPIETTRELATIVERAYPAAWRAKARNHPATRTFQALRMAVNDEIGELERFMDSILTRLAPGGRLAVITFHSLEDRVVKHRMRAWAQGCICPSHLPVCVCKHVPETLLITPKPVCPATREIALNPRAGSAKLRVSEKCSPTADLVATPDGEETADAARSRYEAKKAARLSRQQASRGGAGRANMPDAFGDVSGNVSGDVSGDEGQHA